MKLSDIHIRDPFVLPVPAEGRYYLYGTQGEYTWSDSAVGFDVYTSSDLEDWEGPFPVFRPPAGFWADRGFWAPEVHVYRGRYVMFASFKAPGVCRGTQILAADSPLGPFLQLSAKPVTPPDWECLDGTLHVTSTGEPWIVFCHEWVQVGDGEMCALPLSPDLISAVGPPVVLFRASEAPWAVQIDSKGRKGYVTDGPWLPQLSGDGLVILWSSCGVDGYAVGAARSASGSLLGPWQQDARPLYGRDGGHCMTFRGLDGSLRLSLHHPNETPHERPMFLQLAESTLTAPEDRDR